MQVLAHTKAELSEAGVNVAALDAAAEASGSAAISKSVARSTTVLLVKNLPYSCTEDEIHDLFAKFGVVRVVLPSTRALALVELTDKQVCVSRRAPVQVPRTLYLCDESLVLVPHMLYLCDFDCLKVAKGKILICQSANLAMFLVVFIAVGFLCAEQL
jgi:hypothetical protein